MIFGRDIIIMRLIDKRSSTGAKQQKTGTGSDEPESSGTAECGSEKNVNTSKNLLALVVQKRVQYLKNK